MARASRTKKRGNGRSIDFSQEVQYFEPDMDVELVVKEASWEDGNEHPYIAIKFGGVDEYEDSEIYHNASASPKALHRLRGMLEAMGFEIPKGPLEIDTDELVGIHVMGHTFEDEYRDSNGEKKRSVKVEDFWPVEKSSKSKKGKDEDNKKAGGKKGKSKKLTRSDVEEMDRDDLEALIEEHDLDVDPSSRKLKKDDEALGAAVIEALEEADLLEEVEEVEEEEETKSSKRRRGKKSDDDDEDEGKAAGRSKRGSGKSNKKSKSWSEEDIQDMSEDDLGEVIEEAGLDLDLDDYKTLRKKKNAVIDALEQEGKLAD